ncbi:VrrA/YqfQ family protein [Halalkalibacter okhensis]|uniref:VrrA/YqfQ family protein n=1 Tax=Halalkalibacter okhensis TaxID=333138 RepID=UPI0006919E5E|nr:VrrA/YqfQ family protein [Halalkalibacter okhensis]
MQPFFGPPFGSMPMQAPMQGMSQAANMFAQGAPSANALGGAGSQALRGGGGLLSRLFGGLGGASTMAGNPMMGGFSSAAAGGGMNLTSMLTNAQKVLGLTHQVVPMIQQYGPLIRNAPAIWKIMMSSNSDENATDNSNVDTTETEGSTKINIEETDDSTMLSQSSPIKGNISSVHQTKTHPFKPKAIKGIPGPKLYI